MAESVSSSSSEMSETDTMNAWLEKKKRERDEEVAEIARKTGKDIVDRKTAIEAFLTPQSDPNSPSTSSSSASNQEPTNEAQAIVVEITGLFNSRPVTSLLQSLRFRQQLESVVRASLPSPSRSSESDSRRSQSPRASLMNAISNRNNQTTSATSHSSSDRFNHTPSVADPQMPPQSRAVPLAIPQQPPLPQAPVIPPVFERLVDDSDVSNINRENLVHDISELVHRDLVSNVLESDFRGILENSMQRRLDYSHIPGERSLQALQSLQPNHRMRNDFRDLGIILPQDQDDDSISILSATAHTVPISQTPAASAREIRSLREEMRDMKSTIRLLMEAQLETQRCIRQELSSALHGNAQAAAPAPGTPVTNSGNCLICLTKPSDTMLYRCGHLCMCHNCSMELRHHQATPTCPVCRAPVVDTVRVYAVGASSVN